LVDPLTPASQGNPSPSLFNLITLITYLFSLLLLPFACLACLCASLCSRTLALTPYPTWCVGLSIINNIRDSVFLIFLFLFTNHFILVFSKFVLPKFFTSPPWVLSPTFHFPTFFTFLISFSELASLPACCCCV
jgi:hypothetical protein